MNESNNSRAERREEIKLRLEYAKLASSIAVVGTVLFAGLQWRIANQNAEQASLMADHTVYSRMTGEWREHLRLFVEKPHLRPYFEGGKELTDGDPNREIVLAVADIRLDVMDAVLTYVDLRGMLADLEGWIQTFARAFQTSPAMCVRFRETASNWGMRIRAHAQGVCSLPPPQSN